MHNLTYTERARIAYADGNTELAEALEQLADYERVTENLENENENLENENEARAYANGALDGYNTGNENNPYDTDSMRHAYECGYEYGVHLYCQDNHPEES